jgi:hypothetical protein
MPSSMRGVVNDALALYFAVMLASASALLSPAVAPGHAGSGAHAGYGKRWFETLKAAIVGHPQPAA